jgi:hypothetical protein
MLIFRHVCNIAKKRLSAYCLSECQFFRMEQLGSHWTDFHEIWYLSNYRKSAEKIKVSLKSDKNNGRFSWRQKYTFVITSRWTLLGKRNFSDRILRGNQNTNFMSNCFFSEYLSIFEVRWQNVVDPDIPQTTIRRMCFACWITEATDTHSEYVTVIAFPLQQWLHERTSMFRYTYVACLGYYFCLVR